MSRFSIVVLLSALLVLSACGKSDEQSISETATIGSFDLVADEVLKPVIDSLVQGFMMENSQAKVTVKYVTAGEAVRELMNHQTRAIIIDRYLTPQEQSVLAKDSVTLPEFRMAEDGIGCLVGSGSPWQVVKRSDLTALFSKSGGTPLLLPEYPSSIEYVLDSLAGAAKTEGLVHRYLTSDSIIAEVKSQSRSVGFVSAAWQHKLEVTNDSTVTFLPVIPHDLSSQGISEPVILHIAYIAEKAYPLRTMVMGYTQEPANTVPRGFFAYCMTSHGQNTFKNFGILPKTQKIKLIPSTTP
jgi:phosphate transport system substrate-binding protein